MLLGYTAPNGSLQRRKDEWEKSSYSIHDACITCSLKKQGQGGYQAPGALT